MPSFIIASNGGIAQYFFRGRGHDVGVPAKAEPVLRNLFEPIDCPVVPKSAGFLGKARGARREHHQRLTGRRRRVVTDGRRNQIHASFRVGDRALLVIVVMKADYCWRAARWFQLNGRLVVFYILLTNRFHCCDGTAALTCWPDHGAFDDFHQFACVVLEAPLWCREVRYSGFYVAAVAPGECQIPAFAPISSFSPTENDVAARQTTCAHR